MDRRQKLRVQTPETSAVAAADRTGADLTRDSSILFAPKITASTSSFRESESADMASLDFMPYEGEEAHVEEKEEAPPAPVSSKLCSFIKSNWLSVILLSAFILVCLRPSGYQFLLEELDKVKKENSTLQVVHKVENIAEIASGALVSAHSKIYKHGFFKSGISDPNSILEPGLDNLPLAGQTGFLEITLRFPHSIKKIALYHPETANPASAVKDFRVFAGEKDFTFSYTGKGYEEFPLEDTTAGSIRIEYTSNHGETKYTCIYRLFIFA